MNKVKQLSGIFGLVGMLATAIYFVETRYALAEDQAKLVKRLTIYELVDLKRQAQKSKYFLKDQSRKYPTDEEIKKELDKALEEIKNLDKQINALKVK